MTSLPPLDSRHAVRLKVAGAARAIAIAALLAALLATPWAFAGVFASWRMLIAALLCVAVTGWAVSMLADPLERVRAPIAWWSLMGIVVLGAVQLVPLQPSVASRVSPRAVELNRAMRSEPVSAEAALEEQWNAAKMSSVTLSVYPCATRRRLTLWIMAAAGLLLAANLFRSRAVRLLLIGTMATNGALVALFGVLQKIGWNGMLYWCIPLSVGGSPFGPFVNRNNAAGFLLICLAAAIALLRTAPGLRDDEPSFERVYDGVYRPRLSERDARAAQRPLRDTRVPWRWAVVTLVATGVLASMSRGGAASLAAVSLLLIAVEFGVRKRRARGMLFLALFGFSVATLLWSGLTDGVETRLATFFDEETIRGEARWTAWAAAWRAAGDFLWRGSGLGTFQIIDPMYVARYYPIVFEYAENVFIEVLLGGGALAAGLLALAWFDSLRAAWRLLPAREGSLFSAIGLGGLFALVALALASLADFGLFLPAGCLSLAVFVGLVHGCRPVGEAVEDEDATRLPAAWRRAGPGVALAGITAVGLVWSTVELYRTAVVESAMRETRALVSGERPDARDLRRGIVAMRAATDLVPDDAAAQLRLARLYLVDYRLRLWDSIRDAGTLSDAAAWQRSDPIALHAAFHWMLRNDALAGIDALRVMPFVRETLDPAFWRLLLARRACPFMPETHVVTALLPHTLDAPDMAARSLSRARTLDPADAKTLFDCGVLDWQAGNADGAYESWKQGLALAPDMVDRVIAMVGTDLATPGTAARVLPDDPNLYLEILERHFSDPASAPIRQELAAHAVTLITAGDLPEAEREYMLATVRLSQGDREAAARHMGRALRLRPMEADWHYQFARLLLAQEDMDRAHEHARKSARLGPRVDRYRALLEQIDAERLRRPLPPQSRHERSSGSVDGAESHGLQLEEGCDGETPGRL